MGTTAREAIAKSLEGFEGAIDELLASAPTDVLDPGLPMPDPLRDRRAAQDG